MKSYKLHPDAKSRIDDIWQYTYRNWGKKQADRYIFNIEDRIKKICSNEVVGRIYKPLEDYNVQYISCYRHYVFYQEDESTVFVLTVLHDVMDLPSRVKDVGLDHRFGHSLTSSDVKQRLRKWSFPMLCWS